MPTSLVDPVSPAEPGPPPTGPSRTRVFAALVAALVLLAAGYVVWAGARESAPARGGSATLPAGTPGLLFQNLVEGDGRGTVAVAPLDDPNGTRDLTGLRCDRVHFAGGRGLCLAVGAGFPPIEYAMVFGSDFRVTHEIPLDGLPSRTRVSPDGRYGAATVFVTGHSYSERRLLDEHDLDRHGERDRPREPGGLHDPARRAARHRRRTSTSGG